MSCAESRPLLMKSSNSSSMLAKAISPMSVSAKESSGLLKPCCCACGGGERTRSEALQAARWEADATARRLCVLLSVVRHSQPRISPRNDASRCAVNPDLNPGPHDSPAPLLPPTKSSSSSSSSSLSSSSSSPTPLSSVESGVRGRSVFCAQPLPPLPTRFATTGAAIKFGKRFEVAGCRVAWAGVCPTALPLPPRPPLPPLLVPFPRPLLAGGPAALAALAAGGSAAWLWMSDKMRWRSASSWAQISCAARGGCAMGCARWGMALTPKVFAPPLAAGGIKTKRGVPSSPSPTNEV